MGTIYSRVAGGSNPTTGIPNNVVLAPPAAGEKYKGLGAQTQRVTSIGSLPAAYKAFDPSSGGDFTSIMPRFTDGAGRIYFEPSLLVAPGGAITDSAPVSRFDPASGRIDTVAGRTARCENIRPDEMQVAVIPKRSRAL